MADKANPRDTLAAIPLFAHLSSRQLRRIASSTNEDAYEAGDVIINEGGRSQSMFVILEGTASVVRDGQTLAQRSPGEFFGELSMIDQRPRAASVVADTSMRCLVLEHEVLRDIAMSDPQVAWSLLKTLASRLRDD
jgi:CRP/FNR family transcriptional regulator, cyclic AMP receptor protein